MVEESFSIHAPMMNLLTTDGRTRSLRDVEKQVIQEAITRYNGNMTEVARRLKIGRSTLYRKVQRYALYDSHSRVQETTNDTDYT